MRKKPLLFTIVPIILIGVCASFYFQTAYVLNTPLTNYQRILSKITLSNWVTMITLIVAGITIMRSSKLAKLFMPIAVCIVFWNNYLVATRTNNFTKTQIALAAVLFMLVFAPMYSKRIQMVLSDRRHQWWRTAFRKKHKLPVNVLPLHGDGFTAQTVDVSTTGLFVNVEQRDWTTLPKVGEKVRLNITLDSSKAVTCSAVVVRITEANSFTPRGMGLQFGEFEGKTRKDLDMYLKTGNTKT